MGIRLINFIIFSEILCNPYKQVTLWLFVILYYIYIYEYKHIYIRLAIFLLTIFQFPIKLLTYLMPAKIYSLGL